MTWLLYALLAASALPGTASRTSGSRLIDKGNWQHRLQTSRCLTLPQNLSMCQNIQYNRIRLPNLMGQDSLAEINMQINTWAPLIKLNCNPNTQLFLCSLYAPFCAELINDYIKPCRSFCESVKHDCEPPMQNFGFAWPTTLNCSRFPESEMCIKPEPSLEPTDKTFCKVCRPLESYEAWMYHMCNADIVIRVKVESIENQGKKHVEVKLKRKMKVIYEKPLQEGSIKRDLRKLRLTARNIQDCDCDELKTTATMPHILAIKRNKERKQLYVSSIMTWNKRDKHFRQAMKKVKRKDGCQELADKITKQRTQRDVPYAHDELDGLF